MQGEFSYANGGFKIDLADIDNDGKAELIIGTPRGGVAIYWNASPPPPVGIDQKQVRQINAFPNPSHSEFYLNLPLNEIALNVRITNLLGEAIDAPVKIEGNSINLNCQNFRKWFLFSRDSNQS